MIKCKHSTGLFINRSYMNQVNSLTSIPHEPIVVVHQATMVANHCVVPENIHTPPPPKEDHWKFRGEGGFKGSYFRGVGGIHWKLLFQRVTNHEQNNESNAQSIVSIKTYIRCFQTKIITPGH